MTFNEIDNQSEFDNLFLTMTNSGYFDDEQENPEVTMFQAARYELVASALAVKEDKKINPDFQIGCMIACTPYYSNTLDPDDILLAQRVNQLRCWFSDDQCNGEYPKAIEKYIERNGFCPDITAEDRIVRKEETVDYVGFSYYMSRNVSTAKVKIDDLHDIDQVVVPKGLRWALNFLTDRYHKPLFIVENEMDAFNKVEVNGAIHDSYRIDYLKKHIEKRKKRQARWR